MPVFFFVDPEIMESSRLASIDRITLSYTFFEARAHEVEQLLEKLETERLENVEKARHLQQQKPASNTNARADTRVLLERAMPGLSEHPTFTKPKPSSSNKPST